MRHYRFGDDISGNCPGLDFSGFSAHQPIRPAIVVLRPPILDEGFFGDRHSLPGHLVPSRRHAGSGHLPQQKRPRPSFSTCPAISVGNSDFRPMLDLP